MAKYMSAFKLVWFTTFLMFWGYAMLAEPENWLLNTFMFFSHIFLVAFLLNEFVENVIKK